MNRMQGTLLLLLTASSLQAIAQTSTAVQFQIRNNFTLGSFQGAAFSYKQHLQPSFALRIGVSVSFNDGNFESTSHQFISDTLYGSANSTRDQSGTSIQLNTQAIWYSESPLGILLFYGTGPFVGFSRNHQEEVSVGTLVNVPQSKSTTEGTSTSWSVGLSGLAGVEWFASKTISLHAEYGISLGRYWSNNESTSSYQSQNHSSSTSEGNGQSWSLTSNGVLLGLSVYFR
jgi:hypothetical protein